MTRRLPRDRPAWIALLVFVVTALPLASGARDERSGMIQMTRPMHDTSRNVSIGYTDFLGDRPFFRENKSFVQQLELFNGLAPARPDFYFKRPLYAFLAAQVAPIIGVLPAFLLVNVAGWMVCAYVAWRFTLAVFQDRLAALWAVTFVAGGMGMVAHVGDYSAHLLSFACYYTGAWALFESHVWRTARPLRTHVTLGVMLAVAFLAYNSGLMLLAVYLTVAVRQNRLWHLALTAVLALSGQGLWQLLLAAHGLEYVDIEREYLENALALWRSIVTLPVREASLRSLGLCGEFLTFESPGVVVAGAAGLWLLRRRPAVLWFLLVLIAVPLASGMLFATYAGARGYLVWQISLVFFCLSGRLFALGLRRGRALRVATAVALAAVLVGHVAWSTALLRGDPGPLKIYHFGLDDGWPLLQHGPTRALSMTGAEPTPVLFGGHASLRAAGLWVGHPSAPVPRAAVSWQRAIGMRMLFYLYIGMLGFLFMDPGRARTVVAGLWLVAAVAFPTAAAMRTHERLEFVRTDEAFHVPAFTQVRYQLRLSEQFLSALQTAWTAERALAFHLRSTLGAVQLRVYAGATPIAVRPDPKKRRVGPGDLHYVEDPAGALESLARAREVTFEVTAEETQPFTGWQRADLPGRTIAATTLAGAPVALAAARLPAIETRVLRADRTVELVGF